MSLSCTGAISTATGFTAEVAGTADIVAELAGGVAAGAGEVVGVCFIVDFAGFASITVSLMIDSARK
jgi:hypothetical protein